MWSQKEKEFIREHLNHDTNQLALQATRYSKELPNYSSLLAQIAARQQVRDKLPSWYSKEDLLYPPKLSIEQSSSEITARYKSNLVSGETLADLTGGMGVDTAFLSQSFAKSYYIERQPELVTVARHNFQVLGLSKIETFNEEAVAFLKQMNPVDCIYLDPARRGKTGKKLVLIEDCEPNLLGIQDLLLEKGKQVLIKLSPMLDITAVIRPLKNINKVYVLAVDNECKELLCLMTAIPANHPEVVCINFVKGNTSQELSFSYEEEKQSSPVCASEVKEFLYEPNAAILKAGFYKSIASRFDLEKLSPDSHLYTSSTYIADFPGRRFRVEKTASMNKQELKLFLVDINAAHISVRNFPLSAEDLRKRLRLKDGGDNYIFGTTLANKKHILVQCLKA
jgi:SAM-dependent methyltransferases related to tRNA (uracil-5-)-methyltransferase